MVPWKAITSLACVGAYGLTYHTPARWPALYFLINFAIIFSAQTFAAFVWYVVLWPYFFSPLIKIPGPKNDSWFNGHFSRIRKDPSGFPQVEWINSIPNNGLIRYLGLLNGERIFPTTPKALAEVLVTKNYHFEKPAQMRQNVSRILGLGILFAEGEEHRVQRKNLMPAFAFRHIKDLYPLFWSKSQEAVAAMMASVQADSTATLEVGEWASRATLDIIGAAGLGKDFGAIQHPDSELAKTYKVLFTPSRSAQFLGLLSLLLPPVVVRLLPVKRNEDIRGASQYIRSFCRDLIREKKEKLARKELTDTDILSVALESGGFTDEQLVDQLMTFLAAGHETTASSMTWALYLLCRHPDKQAKLREEIRAHLPSLDEPGSISSMDIDHMPYLNAVCSETLRYYAPAPITLRVAVQDTEIQGQFVPKGTRVMLCPNAINKSIELWGPDALEFVPERWLAEPDKRGTVGGAQSNYAFMTFLHGPRSCIGMAFAKAEFACLLASWIGRFEFELVDKALMDEENMEIKTSITSRPANGLHVRARVVEGW